MYPLMFPPWSVLHRVWFPDDTGRDSWVWVGPLTGGWRMTQLPRVKWRLLAEENGTSPDCIIVDDVVVVGGSVCGGEEEQGS